MFSGLTQGLLTCSGPSSLSSALARTPGPPGPVPREQTPLGRVGLLWRARTAGVENGSWGPFPSLWGQGVPSAERWRGEPWPLSLGPALAEAESPGSLLTFHHQPGTEAWSLVPRE